ncbi:hypothetical protein [Pseudomarimonas salicorniae]|uniref:Uncharacterized protein n=1 Tax=Pseudomarimonas salicorniae TaxID=2933270 RepID=A0ABT0GM50_9GAMM|nr:hypothetical protein [Lysobacter sp. CAU 1642]MCK7595626.1 hypothetical protein [Lysobacter sp. CAU 1642]
MGVPAAEEINIHDSLDERVAMEMFQGKSLSEAFEMFRENSMLCAEALCHMGPRARLYYADAFLNYVVSDASLGDVCAASSLPMVADAVIDSGVDYANIQGRLLEALERVHSQFARYAPDRMTQRIYHQVPGEARKVILAVRRRMRT